ncbi:hypothetical protein BESB_007790 [Besnoitia besnoiti]|uniref:Uncharacterized protein n=1 Tax=Besnoitia besnoiti TaxID=94643 RepID=A0A2A9MQF1_BESBE|nr:hypothetical protein BESB_007790 [Besnoitia besnoiti]PFH38437.1 hypothetical protein BESB_007790 [Besnoitia besnoiti]
MGMLVRQLQRLVKDVRAGRLSSLDPAAAIIRENAHNFGTSLPPDALVDYAECACALGHYDKAAEAVELYEMTEPEDSQTLARAKLLRQVSAIMSASLIFLTIVRPLLRPGWKQHLVDAFENFLRVSAAARNPAVERGSKERVQSAKAAPQQNALHLPWKINLILQSASCLEDAGRVVDAFKATDEAVKLLAEEGANPGYRADAHSERTVLEWKVMLARATLASASDALVTIVRKEAEKNVWSRMQTAAVFAARSPGHEAAAGLAKAWSLVDPEFFALFSRNGYDFQGKPEGSLEAAVAALQAPTASANEQLAAVKLARTAMTLGLWPLARLMVTRLKCWRKLTSRCTLMQELLSIELDVRVSELRQQGSADQAISPEDEDRRRDTALTRRIQAVRGIEECLDNAEQIPLCSDLVEECAVSMWNMARPLFLEPYRSLVYRSLHRASEALERIQSPLAALRVNFLYQVALCEAHEDLPAVAKESIEKALSIDYTSPLEAATRPSSGATEGAYQGESAVLREFMESLSLRPLDRYFKLLYEAIKPQVVTDDGAVTLDQLQLLADRSKSDLSLRNYLPKIEALRDQSLAELAQAERESSRRSVGVEQAEMDKYAREQKVDRLVRLLSQVAQQAFENEQFTVAANLCKTVLSLVNNRQGELASVLDGGRLTSEPTAGDVSLPMKLMVPAENTQTAIAVIQSCYTLALCLSESLRADYKELPGVDVGNGKDGDRSAGDGEAAATPPSKGAGQNTAAETATKIKQSILQLLLVGVRLSKDFGQPWLICNGAIHFWNLHKHILESRSFERTKNFALLECVQELQTHLLIKSAVFPALSKQSVIEEAVTRALPFLGQTGCKDFVASLFESGVAACATPGWIEQLLKTNLSCGAAAPPAPAAKGGKGAKQPPPHPRPPSEIAGTTGGEIQAIFLMERIAKETDVQVKEGLVTRCYDLIEALAEGSERDSDLKAELKARLAVRTFSAPAVFTQLALAFALEAVGEDFHQVPYTVAPNLSRRRRLWIGISHTVIGTCLSALHSDWSSLQAARGQRLALLHLLQACEFAKSTRSPSLALFATRSLWNVVVPLLRVPELCADVVTALKIAAPIAALASRSESLPTLVKMYFALLACLAAGKQWRQVVAVADKAFLQLPKHAHVQVLRFQLLAVCGKEKHPFVEVSEKVKSESNSEGELLLFCARALPAGHPDAVKLYEKAIEVMEAASDIKAADAHLELAELCVLSSAAWQQASKHIEAALALAAEADDMQRRRSFLKACKSEKIEADGRQTSFIAGLGFDVFQRAKTLTALTTPIPEDFVAALTDAVTAVVEQSATREDCDEACAEKAEDAGSSSADSGDQENEQSRVEEATPTSADPPRPSSLLDLREMSKFLPLERNPPPSEDPACDLSPPPVQMNARGYPSSREQRWFENYCLTVHASRKLQHLLLQLGLETWVIPLLHRHAELVRTAESNLGWPLDSDFLHLEQALLSLRLARAFHSCESAAGGTEMPLGSTGPLVDATLAALDRLLPAVLRLRATQPEVFAAGFEGQAAACVYAEQFQQASASQLFVDLAEEFFLYGESRAASEFARAAIRKAENEAPPADHEVILRAIGCLSAITRSEGRGDSAWALLRPFLSPDSALERLSRPALAAVAETLAMAQPRSGAQPASDPLLPEVIQGLVEGERRCRAKEPPPLEPQKPRSNGLPATEPSTSRVSESDARPRGTGDPMLDRERPAGPPALHSLCAARLQLLTADRVLAEKQRSARHAASPKTLLAAIAAEVFPLVGEVVEAHLCSPLMVFLVSRLLPFFEKTADIAEGCLQAPDFEAASHEESSAEQLWASFRSVDAIHAAEGAALTDFLVQLQRMASLVADRIGAPSLQRGCRLGPPELASTLHRSIEFFAVARARLERLYHHSHLVREFSPTVSRCRMVCLSSCARAMKVILAASQEQSAVTAWLRKTTRQLHHDAGKVAEAKSRLSAALRSITGLSSFPLRALSDKAEKDVCDCARKGLESVGGDASTSVGFGLNAMEISFLSEVALLNLYIARAEQEMMQMESAGDSKTDSAFEVWEAHTASSCGQLQMVTEDCRSFLLEGPDDVSSPLHLRGGNKTESKSEKTFHYAMILHALHTLRQAEWLHSSLSDPTVFENVCENELRRIREAWIHPRRVPRAQQLEAYLSQKRPFWRIQRNLLTLPSSFILQQVCPRQLCVASLQHRGHALQLSAAVTLHALEGDRGPDSVRYFAERLALPPQLQMQDPPEENGTHDHIEAFMVHLLENLELRLKRMWFQERVQSIHDNRACRDCAPQHLLLLLDPCLVRYPFEKFPVITRLFGPHVSRDYSLHLFVYRMLQAEASFSMPNRRSVTDMRLQFARDSVTVLGDPRVGDSERARSSAQINKPKDLDQPASPQELHASDRCLIQRANYTMEDFTDFVCTQSPQVVWTPSFELLLQRGIDPSFLVDLDMSHLILVGSLDWTSHKTAVHQESRQHSTPAQRALFARRHCDLALLLSMQGVSTVVLSDESSTPKADARQGMRILNELLKGQPSLMNIV